MWLFPEKYGEWVVRIRLSLCKYGVWVVVSQGIGRVGCSDTAVSLQIWSVGGSFDTDVAVSQEIWRVGRSDTAVSLQVWSVGCSFDTDVLVCQEICRVGCSDTGVSLQDKKLRATEWGIGKAQCSGE